MKSKISMWINAIALLAALAVPVSLAAQDNAEPHHHHQYHHYQLIDPGTFGGPASYNESDPLENIINEQGVSHARPAIAGPIVCQSSKKNRGRR